MAEQNDKCPGCGAAVRDAVHCLGTTFVTHYYECDTTDCRDEWPVEYDHVPTHKSLHLWTSKECYRRQLVAEKAENARLKILVALLTKERNGLLAAIPEDWKGD